MERRFIKATEEHCSFAHPVNAPCFRRSFMLEELPKEAWIAICGLGFYRLFLNGRELTRGRLAPYISNPDHIAYVDRYQVAEMLLKGKNVISVLLGNGFYNNFGGSVWDFDREPWVGAPRLALEFTAGTEAQGISFKADESFKVHPSPILFDDIRMGEWYDAGRELPGWTLPEFDDSSWTAALPAEPPRGELRECSADPIIVEKELAPVSITRQGEGYLYDFGENTAGLTHLRIRKPCRGQRITIWHSEYLADGQFDKRTILFDRPETQFYKEYAQKTVYLAKGEELEEYLPSFTYYGFRYAFVEGIRPDQAVPELLTFEVMHSDLRSIGGFSCSDPVANTLMEMVKRTDLANFYYFPTDCPHREKNGWTGDAQVSAAHLTYLFDVEKSYREWLHNIRKSQKEWGELPGIIPTGSWGYAWGNGPAWDAALFELPWQLYSKKGNQEVIRENAHAMVRYLDYIMTRRSEDGTIGIGLGDWVPVGKYANEYETPESVTSTIYVLDMAEKAARMLSAIGYVQQAAFAGSIAEELKNTFRRVWVDEKTCSVKCRTQTAQSMALYYGLFEKEEEQRAFDVLMELIHEKGDSFDCGMLGIRTIFSVLACFGEADLAYHMITRPQYPSYGHLIETGETTLTECFVPDGHPVLFQTSHNHHLFCDVARFFIEDIAGLKVTDPEHVTIAPHFVEALDHAEASHELPLGRVCVSWQREEEGIRLKVSCPSGVCCTLALPKKGADRVKTVIKEEA